MTDCTDADRTSPTTDVATETWVRHLNAWRTTLCTELLALPLRIRDAKTLRVQRNLTLSIKTIDFGLDVITDSGDDVTTLRLGELMIASGFAIDSAGALPWFGSLKEVDRRLKAIERRRHAQRDDASDTVTSHDERARV
jgi:hypothetical protein